MHINEWDDTSRGEGERILSDVLFFVNKNPFTFTPQYVISKFKAAS